MKTQLKLAASVLLAIIPLTYARAEADKGGNGGGAEYCPTPTATQLKIQTYDLWEGRDPIDSSLRREIPFDDGVTTKEKYLENALTKIRGQNRALAEALVRALGMLNSGVQDKGNKTLALVEDANALYNDKGCQYLQLVNWVDRAQAKKLHGIDKEVILRDETSYLEMDNLNQAANDLHEAAYKVRRAFGLGDETGSVYVRRFVAQTFSTAPIDADVLAQISSFGRIVEGEALSGKILQHVPGLQGQPEFFFYYDQACSPEEAARGEVAVSNIGTASIWTDADASGFVAFMHGKRTLRPGETARGTFATKGYVLKDLRKSHPKTPIYGAAFVNTEASAAEARYRFSISSCGTEISQDFSSSRSIVISGRQPPI